MLGQETCIGCASVSPEANSDNTLTTSFGWRLIRVVDAKGVGVIEWRCATCWAKYKAMQAARSEPPSARISSNPPRAPHRNR